MSTFSFGAPSDADAPEEGGGALEVITGTLVEYDAVSRDHQGRRARGDFKFNDQLKAAYLALLRQGVRRYKAAAYCGITHSTVILHMKRFPDFADAVEEAEQCRLDDVEEAMFQAAIDGNVTAQQVILYNRRGQEWADQRMMRARLEAAAAADEATERRKAESALDGLRDKLGELRERLTEDGDTPPATPDAEPVLVDVDAAEES